MNPSNLEIAASIIFLLAIVHTFLVSKFAKFAHRYPEGSVHENLFHYLAEIEAVFGIWSILFFTIMIFYIGYSESVHYIETLNFTEPAFVFVIMAMAGTKPIVQLAEKLIIKFSKLIPLSGKMAFYLTVMILGPLVGSFITEPAAMTVTALILLKYFFSKSMSLKFKYATIGLLFVNVSIGGTLSHFAAPPVLMVASKWGWGLEHMFVNFGYKGAISCFISTILITLVFKKELTGTLDLQNKISKKNTDTPIWVICIHLLFLIAVVITAHHLTIFIGLFLFFLGFTSVTKEFQDSIKIKESLMVGFFLAGLIVLGTPQKWWLQPLITNLSDYILFFGATGLTALTDNAALTYLGSLVELSDSAKYYLLAGAVSGGGLTVIANAPNPAGYGILKVAFDDENISPLGILKGALIPTIISLLCFGLLP
ncbi:putative Na+/H+ antiporter [Bacteriovorax sp. PP10]|uniref:Na+/H+ antiporter n=1 Tax=Bacteriovorax antarcticus TaxID=3088717 RepID=A0ABU5VTA7_9BACT|nr:putative Na+/H+ antiporter [Bacteriovorax sp. PP10]MEA9356283.1 putative Na+/H+ antiporter [Bacteriovorax sp. PP10]